MKPTLKSQATLPGSFRVLTPDDERSGVKDTFGPGIGQTHDPRLPVELSQGKVWSDPIIVPPSHGRDTEDGEEWTEYQ